MNVVPVGRIQRIHEPALGLAGPAPPTRTQWPGPVGSVAIAASGLSAAAPSVGMRATYCAAKSCSGFASVTGRRQRGGERVDLAGVFGQQGPEDLAGHLVGLGPSAVGGRDGVGVARRRIGVDPGRGGGPGLSARMKLSTSSIQRLDQIWLASTGPLVVVGSGAVVATGPWSGEATSRLELPQAATVTTTIANAKTLPTRRTRPP